MKTITFTASNADLGAAHPKFQVYTDFMALTLLAIGQMLLVEAQPEQHTLRILLTPYVIKIVLSWILYHLNKQSSFVYKNPMDFYHFGKTLFGFRVLFDIISGMTLAYLYFYKDNLTMESLVLFGASVALQELLSSMSLFRLRKKSLFYKKMQSIEQDLLIYLTVKTEDPVLEKKTISDVMAARQQESARKFDALESGDDYTQKPSLLNKWQRKLFKRHYKH